LVAKLSSSSSPSSLAMRCGPRSRHWNTVSCEASVRVAHSVQSEASVRGCAFRMEPSRRRDHVLYRGASFRSILPNGLQCAGIGANIDKKVVSGARRGDCYVLPHRREPLWRANTSSSCAATFRAPRPANRANRSVHPTLSPITPQTTLSVHKSNILATNQAQPPPPDRYKSSQRGLPPPRLARNWV
jgi:hypothetical protein